MKVELTEEDIRNLIVFVARNRVKGDVQEVAVILKHKLAEALRPALTDGSQPAEALERTVDG